MSIKNTNKKEYLTWEIGKGEKDYLKEPYILKKGKDYITIEKNFIERGNLYIQKIEERRNKNFCESIPSKKYVL